MTISSTLLRAALLCMATVVLALCTLVLPRAFLPPGPGEYLPLVLGLYLSSIPFFFALFQGWKLLGFIDGGTAFSFSSVRALGSISICGVFTGLLYSLGLPYFYHLAQLEDAPGIMALGCIIVFVSFVIALFAGLLKKLLEEVVRIKSENELTV